MATDDAIYSEATLRDPLTNLPNRLLLEDRIETAIAQAARAGKMTAVCVIDLAKMKEISVAMGLSAGEELLQRVANNMSISLRRADTLASLGGDLFAIVMPQVSDLPQILSLIGRTMKLFDGPWVIGGCPILLSPSVGVACYPSDAPDARSLLGQAAAAALRAAAEDAREPRFADPALQGEALSRLSLGAHLLHAVEHEEFVLYYQPQVSVQSGQICGVEALLRWEHPEHGLVSPAEFVPLAEDTGLIVPLGAWVIDRACRQLAAWRAAGLPRVRLAVNLAAPQLADDHLVEVVQEAIAAHQIEASDLELEITERVAFANETLTASVLGQLKRLGVRLTLDDFGTGYSSALLLAQLPFDTMKVDRSFVAKVLSGPKERAVTEGIIGLSHKIGLSVVAEGVETREQLVCMKALGADEIQGYLFSRPLSVDDMTAVMASNTFRDTMLDARRTSPVRSAPDAASARREARGREGHLRL
jgi:polar amino acid transport system substrate-binding protein